jgi:hypothetical protein
MPRPALLFLSLIPWALTPCSALAQSKPEGGQDPPLAPAVGVYLRTLEQARARTAAKQWKQAAELWAKVVEENPVDGDFCRQLALARYHDRDFAGAITAYKRVLELGSSVPSSTAAYNIACCHALRGDKEQAVQWLERSFRMGFRPLRLAQGDADLRSLHDDARFRKIVGLPDTATMTRDEGWRYDLALLAREVKRTGYSPFRFVSREEFDAAVKRLHDSIPHLTDVQIVIEMMKLLRTVGDGHTGVLGAPGRPEFAHALPVQLYLFQEGLYIIAADPKYRELLGAEVLRLGDHTVPQVMGALDPLVSRDNDLWPAQMSPYRMRHPALLKGLGLIDDDKQVSLRVRGLDGQQRTVTVAADSTAPDIWNVLPHPKHWVSLPQTLKQPVPLYLKNMGTHYWFEHLPQAKVVYCQYNRVLDAGGETLAEFSDRLFQFIHAHDVAKLVIDLRWNNGGNTYLNEPFLHELIGSAKVNRRGKLFVIIGRRTFSAAQNAASLFERHTEATFVGEPTGSSPNFVGEEPTFTLPYSKILANVSDLYWQSGWPMDHRKWIAPHVYVPPTFAAYRANRDPAMEVILAYPAVR